jgi:hypothetical protein
MRITKIRYKMLFFLFLFSGIGALWLPGYSAAGSNILNDFSFDDCIPFEARAVIMEVHAGKAQLVAGEQTIFVVDMGFGDDRLITELTDADGKPLDLGSFSRGQWVYVKGFKHIDGGVVASQVQRIDPPERKRPVVRTIKKQSRRDKRLRRRAAVIEE